MIDGQEIPIKVLNGAPRSWVCLQGTILTFRERFWSKLSTLDIPIELIAISEKRRFRGSRFIVALLFLLAGLLVGTVVFLIPPLPETTKMVALIAVLCLGFVLFLAKFSKFLLPQPTLTIRVSPQNIKRTFWLDHANEHAVRRLFDAVEQRKSSVQQTAPYPMQTAIGDIFVTPWKQTVALMFVFSLPTIVTEIHWLLFLPLAPLALHLYRYAHALRAPKLYREAIRHFLRRDFEAAAQTMKRFIDQEPDSPPARIFLIDVSLVRGDFPTAESELSAVAEYLDTDELQDIQEQIILRRRIWERKNSLEHIPHQPPDDDAPASS